MEEEIKIIEEMLRLNKNRIEPQIVQAIENLINKYKEQYQRLNEMALELTQSYIKTQEQEKIIKKYKAYSKSTYDDYANAIVRLQEQEKTIQLMSEELAELNYEYCGKWCKGKKCKDYYENHFIDEESCNGNKLSCIINYFKMKARDENGNKNDN